MELQSRYRLGSELRRVQIGLEILYYSNSLTLDGLGLVEGLSNRVERLKDSGVGILSKTDLSMITSHFNQYKQERGA
jgi:hypothetical protein